MGIEPTGVPFVEAIAYLRQKVNLPTKAYTDVYGAQNARGFVVAGAIKEALVSDLRNAVAKGLEKGTTLAEFRKDFDKTVAENGWDYKGERGPRTATILNTNLRMAYAAGRWQQAQDLKARRPYGRYVHVSGPNERKEHASWHGTVLLLDDPWVSTHWGPCGWGCKCSWQTLSERDIKRYGYQIASAAPEIEFTERKINTPSGKVTVQTPKGIDPGFGYNPGEAAWGRGAQSLAMEKHGPWEALISPGAIPPTDLVQAVKPVAQMGKRAADEAGLRAALRKAIGGDQAIFTDPTGARVNLSQAIVDHMVAKPGRHDGREAFFPFMREVVEDPTEVWVGFARSASITTAGPATSTSMRTAWIGGARVQWSVASGATAAEVAADLAYAINANLDLVFTAAVDGTDPAKVNTKARPGTALISAWATIRATSPTMA